MKLSRYVGISLFLVLITTTLSAQPRYATSGREFYIGFASNYYLNVPEPSDTMELMILSDVQATGLVEVPALKFSQSFAVFPGTVTTVGLPSGNGEGTVVIGESGAVVKGLAVHVTSNQDVTVIGINHKVYSSDAFLAYPNPTCGMAYRAVCLENSGLEEGYTGQEQMPGEFLIASSQDSTHVTITPRALTSDGHRRDSAFIVTLDKGDLYEVQSDVSVATGDLTGSLISSDKPIALYSGHSRTEIPYAYMTPDSGGATRNHLIEQLLPLELWEDSAVVVPLASQGAQGIARIVAGYDSTVVTIFHVIDTNQRVVLNAGQFYQVGNLNQPSFITATHPIEVAQYLHTDLNQQSAGDPAMVMTPSLRHMEWAIAIGTPTLVDFTANKITLILSAPDTAFSWDGTTFPFPAPLTPIPHSRYYYATMTVGPGEHSIAFPHRFSVMTYGMGQVDAYAYSGGLPLAFTPFSDVAELPMPPPTEARIFPNPTDGPITIANVPPNARVTMTDALGRALSVDAQHSAAGCQLDLSKLPSGVYLVIIESGGVRTMERVVRE